jgi:hypothetical protein
MPKALSGLRGRLAAAVSLYVAHYNLCRVHETLTPSAKQQTTPAIALGLTAHPWLIGDYWTRPWPLHQPILPTGAADLPTGAAETISGN